MSSNRDIRDAIKKIVGQDEMVSIACKVIEINGYVCDVEPLNGDATILDVRLQVANVKGLYIKPKKGSIIYISSLDENNYFVTLYSEIEEIVFGGGEFGGFVKVLELKKNLDKNNELIQSLLNVIQGSPIPEPGNGSPSALQTALVGAIGAKQLGNFNDIENKKITHGNFS
jgi:hypothetical protein